MNSEQQTEKRPNVVLETLNKRAIYLKNELQTAKSMLKDHEDVCSNLRMEIETMRSDIKALDAAIQAIEGK